MKISRIAGIAALLTAGFAQAQTPAIKLDGVLFEFWQTQMMDNSLRLDSAAKPGGNATYYEGLNGGKFAENTFNIKRAEIYFSGVVTDTISWNAMFDPNNNITATAPSAILQDLVITWAPVKGFNVKAGQFKMPTTYEATMVAAREILFFERNQINRVFGDKRDRGIWASYAYGDAKGFQGKLNLAISNGTTDDGSGGKTATDANAQKDYTFRFEGAYGSAHKFGAYYREGVMSLKDSGFTAPGFVTSTWVPAVPPAVGGAAVTTSGITSSWAAAGVTAQQIKDNKDKTTLQGVYYAFKNDSWQFSAEYATGLLGRRFPTLFAGSIAAPTAATATTGPNTTTQAPGREHLDQKFTGYAVDGAYKMGNHWITARYDFLNYNSGDNWYTAYNPYTQSAVNTPLLVAGAPVDYTPKYTEITVGYNYVFIPTKQSAGKLKLDYVMRSKNFLAPSAAFGQTGEQGGNSLVASLMVSY
jgi:hypothetical protein